MDEFRKKELHQKLMEDKEEAQRLITEFHEKIKELCEGSITDYGRLWIHAYAPVEVDWRERTHTFIEPETNAEMYRYLLSEIQIVPLTFVCKLKNN